MVLTEGGGDPHFTGYYTMVLTDAPHDQFMNRYTTNITENTTKIHHAGHSTQF